MISGFCLSIIIISKLQFKRNMNTLTPQQAESNYDAPVACHLNDSTRDAIRQFIKQAIRGQPSYDELHLELFLLDEEECKQPYLTQYLCFHNRIEVFQNIGNRRRENSEETDNKSQGRLWDQHHPCEECLFCGLECHSSSNEEFDSLPSFMTRKNHSST